MNEHHSFLHHILSAAREYWFIVSALTVTLAGAISWWWSNWFNRYVTKSEFRETLTEFRKENNEQHERIYQTLMRNDNDER